MNASKKTLYGVGNFANGVTLQALTSYLIFFATSILGISGTVVGLIVSISVVWDAISDLLTGYLSDRTPGKLGKRHPYMLVGTLGLALVNGLIWRIDGDLPSGLKVGLLFAGVMLIKTMMTVFVTPYNALGSELSKDYYERASIQAYRTVFFTLGLAFTTVAGMIFYFKPSSAYPVGQLNPASYSLLGGHMAMIVLVSGLVATFSTWHKKQFYKPSMNRKKKLKEVIVQEMSAFFGNRNYLYVSGAYLSANIASAILGAIGLHVFTYTFAMNNVEIGSVFGVIFGLSVLSQTYYLRLTRLHGKKPAALKAVRMALISSLIFLVLVFLREQVMAHFWLLFSYAVPAGIGVGGLITLPFAMVSDTVDEEELSTGVRSEGLYFGGLTFAYKISQSLAIFLVGIILDLIGFNGDIAIQSQMTSYAMGLVVGIGTLFALLGARYFYHKYRLTRDEVEQVKAALEARRED